jgi:hypothetical protein
VANSIFVVLKELSNWKSPNKPGSGFALQVVQEIRDGKDPCTLRGTDSVHQCVGVRKVWYSQQGEKVICKMLAFYDFKKVDEHRPQIEGWMRSPPPVPGPKEPAPLAGGTFATAGDTFRTDGGLGGGRLEREDF